MLQSVGLGFTKGKGDNYFIIIEEGLIPRGIVIHRTLIPTTREHAEKFIGYMQRVLTGGLIIANEGEVPPLPQEEDLG